jgi:hypothetical protein
MNPLTRFVALLLLSALVAHADGFFIASGPEALPAFKHDGKEIRAEFAQKVKPWKLPPTERVSIAKYTEWEFDKDTAKFTFHLTEEIEVPAAQWFFVINGMGFVSAGGHTTGKKTKEISIVVPLAQADRVTELIAKHIKFRAASIENFLAHPPK